MLDKDRIAHENNIASIEILDRCFQFGTFLVGAFLCGNGEHFIVCGRVFLNSFDAEQLAACLLSNYLSKEIGVPSLHNAYVVVFSCP